MRTDESVIIYTQRPGLPLDTSEYISLVRLCRFVAKGMAASIKIDTFNFQKYGMIDGEVIQISKDSIIDEQLGMVYKMRVKPKKTSLIVEGKKIEITAGMTLTSEVNVGKRRIIEFFIYPLIKYLDEGMSVR